jgi:NADPH:quinone reductase-like Zn-dependent oxidoreductase
MKAVVYEEYGPPEVLHLSEVGKPNPQENEVLIRVRATSVTKYDCWMRSCTGPPGFGFLMRLSAGRTPKQPILGTELAGEIETAGKVVTRFETGDQVYGYPGMSLGAYAEHICLPEEAVAVKPTNLSFEEAGGVLQGALTALFFLRKADIQPGQKVLIFGASGGVGGYATQLAKHHFGAEVTGVCSTPKLEYVKSLGADQVIDYTKEDFTQTGQVYDVILDTVGKTLVARIGNSLREDGWYLLTTFGLPKLIQLLFLSLRGRRNLEYGTLAETIEDLILLRDLLESSVIKPTIDRIFPLEEAAEAHRYVESGQKMGNVVLSIS